MKVPLSWLREFVDVPVEPRKLADDLTAAGLAVDAVETHGGDAVLDIDVTTNRVDCMNVYGVAREVSVLYDRPLRPLELTMQEAGPPAAEALTVSVEAPDLCPRFCARVLDVRLAPSPAWIRDRLEMVGVRPIANVVDLTNYVMMEMGHPSHAFDLAKVPEARLVIRWARAGERLTTLDGVHRTLTARTGVVAGPQAALGVAGVMGGASSEVSEDTRVVALEAAYWEPLAIRRAAKDLGMRTEASHRFERGADPEGPVAATARIAHLLAKIGAGRARPGLIDRYVAPRPVRTALLRPRRIEHVLGGPVPGESARRILTGLGFGLGPGERDQVTVTIPTWRGDVSREVDLVEEVARHHGLDKLPFTIPPGYHVGGLEPSQALERAIRVYLEGAGLTEVINYSFVSDAQAGRLVPPRARLLNPLSDELDALRSSLVVPGLLRALQTNLRQGRRDVRLFEVGRVFRADRGAVEEVPTLAILLAGPSRPVHWSEKPPPSDVFHVKGLLEGLTERLGLGDLDTAGSAEPPAFLHPGQCAAVVWSGKRIGWLGAVHPDVAAAWELRDETLVAELHLPTVLASQPPAPRVRPLPRFPAVTRDLSVLCDASVAAERLVAWVREAGGESLRAVAIVDRYEGAPVPAGKVSVTLTLRYQDPARTLTGDEVQASVGRVVEELRRRGAEIRGE
jgi:phenylalanyl-tRNA synthetase beta chain